MKYQWTLDEAETFAFKADDEGIGHAIGYAPDNDAEFASLADELIAAWRKVALYAERQCANQDIVPDSDWTYCG